MDDTAKKGATKGCGLSFSVLLLAGGVWTGFKALDQLSSPSVSSTIRIPEEHKTITDALQLGIIATSVLLPIVLWISGREAYAKGTLKGILLFWLLAGILTLIAGNL